MSHPAEGARATAAPCLVARWHAETAVTDELQARMHRPRTLVRWRPGDASRRERLRDHHHALENLAEHLGRHGVGSAGRWGSLSSVHGSPSAAHDFWLDNTLLRATATARDSAFRAAAADLRARLPFIRAAAHDGDGSAAEMVDATVRALAANGDISARLRRLLLDHLPADQRPVAGRIEEIARETPVVTLRVTEHHSGGHLAAIRGNTGEPHIYLHDIVVPSYGTRRGIATATLQELTAYANVSRLPILAQFIPTARSSSSEVRAIAAWYSRLGFTVAGAPSPADWKISDTMRWDPQARQLY
jgi:hypothetical protein